MAGVANWLVALPIDVVKSRIQMSTAKGVHIVGIASRWGQSHCISRCRPASLWSV
jgi:hypothetical protein